MWRITKALKARPSTSASMPCVPACVGAFSYLDMARMERQKRTGGMTVARAKVVKTRRGGIFDLPKVRTHSGASKMPP